LFVSCRNRTLIACVGNGNKNGCPYSKVRFFLFWEDLDLRFVCNLPNFVEKWERIDWFSQRLRFTCIPERSCSERDTCTSKMIDQFINFIIRPPRLGTKLMVYSLIWLNLNYTILCSNFKWEGLNHVLCHIYRAEYDPDQYLCEKEFALLGRQYQRKDLEASMDMLCLIQLPLCIYGSYFMITIYNSLFIFFPFS